MNEKNKNKAVSPIIKRKSSATDKNNNIKKHGEKDS